MASKNWILFIKIKDVSVLIFKEYMSDRTGSITLSVQ